MWGRGARESSAGGFDLAGDEGGGGEALRGVGQGGGQGRKQGVHWFHFLGSQKNQAIGLIWLGTRGGLFDLAGDEVGGWGGWAREAGKGEMGRGGTTEQCGSNKACGSLDLP